jgi:hypothetical protein
MRSRRMIESHNAYKEFTFKRRGKERYHRCLCRFWADDPVQYHREVIIEWLRASGMNVPSQAWLAETVDRQLKKYSIGI